MRLLKCLFVWGLLLAAAGCGKSTAYWSQQLKSPDSPTRLRAVNALRERVQDPGAVPLLVQALQDEDTFIRRDAARALGKFGTRAHEAAPALRSLLNDREPSVRKAAAQSLKQLDANASAQAETF